MLLKKVCNAPSGKVEWSSIELIFMCQYMHKAKIVLPSWTVGLQIKHLLQCSCEYPILSQSFFFPLTSVNVINRKVFRVFKDVDVRNINPSWFIGLEQRVCQVIVVFNLDGHRGRGLTCTCSEHFRNRSSVLFITSVTFSLFYFLSSYKTGNLDVIIETSSFIFLCYDLSDPPFVYCCSFSSCVVNKMVGFCYEKVCVRL